LNARVNDTAAKKQEHEAGSELQDANNRRILTETNFKFGNLVHQPILLKESQNVSSVSGIDKAINDLGVEVASKTDYEEKQKNEEKCTASEIP